MPSVRKQSATSKPTSKSAVGRITKLSVPDGGVKVAVYGQSGSGKTTLWGTFPKPILALIASGGKHPGELRSLDTPELRSSIDSVVLEQTSDITELAAYAADSKYKTLVLDHATGLQDLVLREILGLNEAPVQMGWGTASQQQWGQVALQMKERLRSLLDLPQNVVIVAQEREFNTDTESQILMPYVGCALTPSVCGWLNTAVDYICQTFKRQRTEVVETKIGTKTVKQNRKVQGIEYCLRVGPDAVYTTKFRVPRDRTRKVLPESIVDPDYTAILALIKGKSTV